MDRKYLQYKYWLVLKSCLWVVVFTMQVVMQGFLMNILPEVLTCVHKKHTCNFTMCCSPLQTDLNYGCFYSSTALVAEIQGAGHLTHWLILPHSPYIVLYLFLNP